MCFFIILATETPTISRNRQNMNRRTFTKGLLGLTGAGLLTGFYTWQIEPFWLEFVRKKMPIKNLPKALEGLTLMQISDVHVGNAFDWNFIIESFKKAQALQPDFAVYTGDYMSYETDEQIEQLKTVFEHAVRGKLGTIGILGNHDYGIDWLQPEVAETVTEVLTESGIEVLRNEQKSFNGLNIIGIDDAWGTNFNPKSAMGDLDKNQANLALCHNPDVCDMDVWDGYQSWILSGHTHGGQCKPPFLPPPLLPVKNRRYSAGEIDLKDGRTLYINRALGHLLQVRFNVRPEITVFELRAG